MELICLVNFAEVGLMSLFAQLDGPAGENAEADLRKTIEAIRRTFAAKGADGVNRLSESTAAILRGKYAKYLV